MLCTTRRRHRQQHSMFLLYTTPLMITTTIIAFFLFLLWSYGAFTSKVNHAAHTESNIFLFFLQVHSVRCYLIDYSRSTVQYPYTVLCQITLSAPRCPVWQTLFASVHTRHFPNQCTTLPAYSMPPVPVSCDRNKFVALCNLSFCGAHTIVNSFYRCTNRFHAFAVIPRITFNEALH